MRGLSKFGEIYRFFAHRHDVSFAFDCELEFLANPVVFIVAAIERSRRKQEKEVGPLGNLFSDLLFPFACVDGIDIEEHVIAVMSQFLFQRAREGPARGIATIADEDCLSAHERFTHLT